MPRLNFDICRRCGGCIERLTFAQARCINCGAQVFLSSAPWLFRDFSLEQTFDLMKEQEGAKRRRGHQKHA